MRYKMEDIIGVILIGGSGKRLFPISTPDNPKQFITIDGKYSLFQNTVLRLANKSNIKSLYFLVNIKYYNIAVQQYLSLGLKIPIYWIFEPCSRNTGPILYLLSTITVGRLLIVPSDHILDEYEFRNTIDNIPDEWVQNNIVTLGIQPTYPETGYGYILHNNNQVSQFVEKPDRMTAELLIRDKALWNGGIFHVHSSLLKREFETYASDIVDAVNKVNITRTENEYYIGEDYKNCPDISIDYAVMVHTPNKMTKEYNGLWTDIGSWKSWYEYCITYIWKNSSSDDINYVEGDVDCRKCTKCLIINRSDRKCYVMGLSEMIVIQTNDKTLTIPMDMCQHVKEF